MCKINLNQELNGIELSFESKPERATLDAIKAQGFRWNGKKSVWYAKQSAERLTFAETLGQIETKTETKTTNKINLDNLGENTPHLGGADLSKAIREDLKRRGVKGCTVKVFHHDSITVTYTATPEDFASIEEAKERFTLQDLVNIINRDRLYLDNHYVSLSEYEAMTEAEQEALYTRYIVEQINKISEFRGRWADNRNDYFELSAAGFEKLNAIYKIANQWNYDNSDIMTDYFDVGYYLNVDIKHPAGFEVRKSMTEEEREAYTAEKEREAEERAAQLAKMEEERREAEENEKKYNKWVKEAEERIYNDVIVEDLDESEQLYIVGMREGHGKEASREELEESATETERGAVVSRIVTFNNAEAWEDFNKLYLHDFIFVYGKGGTGSEDVRVDRSLYDYSQEQRDTIIFYSCDCVAVKYQNKIQLVIDPQGYNYSRYVYIVNDDAKITSAAAELERQRKESESKEPFYFPADVEKQTDVLKEGQEVTIYQCDGWMLTNIYAGSGIVMGVWSGTYAQYKGVYIELINKKGQTRREFIRNNHDCLIYSGIYGALPEEVTRRKISDTMSELYNADVLMKNTYNYYKSLGIMPIVDTCYR